MSAQKKHLHFFPEPNPQARPAQGAYLAHLAICQECDTHRTRWCPEGKRLRDEYYRTDPRAGRN